MDHNDYRIEIFPKSRLATVDVGRYGAGRHSMFGLLEVDVSNARKNLRKLRRQGHNISFTAWIIKLIGDCVARNKSAHAIRRHRRKLVLFNDVDIAIPVEKNVDNKSVPLPLLIKSTNRKSMKEIDREIKRALQREISDEQDYILSEHGFTNAVLKLYYAFPQFARIFLWRLVLRNPYRFKKQAGTVLVTTVNAVGSPAWILPTRSMHSLSFALGTITRKPWVCDKQIQIREILNLTVCFDHDVIDGIPARKFMQELIKNLENGDIVLEEAGTVTG